MNLTNQYIANPKSVDAYISSLVTYTSIRPSSAKLRLGDDRQILNDKKEYKIFRLDNIEFKMIRCPRGKFTMAFHDEFGDSEHEDESEDGREDGSEDECYKYYNSKRVVSINKPFLLGETEVTQELFEKVMGYNPSNFQGKGYPNSNKRPVEVITVYEAVMFCNKLSERFGKKPYYNISNIVYKNHWHTKEELPNIRKATITINPRSNGFRLPLEKEWEYAAKAGTNNRWAGTDDENKVGEVAWFYGNSEINGSIKTHPVKGKRPNEWGFYDMSGNVWELCDDYSPACVYRGGSYRDFSKYLRYANQAILDDNLGFRVSASLFN